MRALWWWEENIEEMVIDLAVTVVDNDGERAIVLDGLGGNRGECVTFRLEDLLECFDRPVIEA